MKKTFCDCCGKEVNSVSKFSYLCHIDEILDNKIGYIDNEFNPVSGRENIYDLCHRCYNRVLVEAVKKFRELKNKDI